MNQGADITTNSTRGFITHPDTAAALPAAGGHLLCGAGDSAGLLTVISSSVSSHDRTPRHTHTHEDECLYVLDGHYRIECGDDVFEATRGSFVHLPRGVPHGIETEGGSMLIITVPGGFEEFFTDIGAGVDLAELGERHGIRPAD